MIGVSLLNARISVLGHAAPELPPEALAFRAQEILRQLDYFEKPEVTAYGFEYASLDYLSYLDQHHISNRDALLASHQPAVVGFWFRQSQEPIWADGFLVQGSQIGAVAYDSPANTAPGMIRLMLDSDGRLIDFQARPPALSGATVDLRSPDWTPLFDVSGLDQSRFSPEPPEQTPPMAFDQRAAWVGTFVEGRTEKVRVEAAQWQGRLVFFNITGEWTQAQAIVPEGRAVLYLLFIPLLAGAGWSAWNNLRLGRGDRRGAGKIAAVIFLSMTCVWLLEGQHVGSFWELHLAVSALSLAAFVAGLIWLLYIGIEPNVRRNWPDALISWTRLEAGRLRDPLVASHILAGIAISCTMFPVINALNLAGSRLWGPWALNPISLLPLNGVARYLGELLFIVVVGTLTVTGLLFIVVSLRLLTRRTIVADIAGSVLLGASALSVSAGFLENFGRVALTTVVYYALVWMLRRFGLLTAWMGVMAGAMLTRTPLTFSSWYTGRSLALLLVFIAIDLWALWVILAAARTPSIESAGA
jgi:hypothetical protein